MNTEFEWRLADKSECYQQLLSWWRSHDAFHGKIIEYKTLPNRIFIVSNKGKDLFAIPVYISDSDFCYIGWVTGNPEAGIKEKYGALEFLYKVIFIVMKSQGFDHILSKTNESGLRRVLENTGFQDADKTHFYIKNL